MKRRQALALLTSITLLCGCGGGVETPPLGKVTGTVSLNGTPTAGISVAFHPQAGGKTVMAVTNDKGEYTMQYDENNAGAIVGVNDVAITWAETDEAPVQYDEKERPIAPPAKADIPDTYEKTADVKAGDNVFNFDLK